MKCKLAVPQESCESLWPSNDSFSGQSLGFISSFSSAFHMGAEPQNSFKGGSRGPVYGKLTTRHHRLWDYVSQNQTCKVFGDFGQKNWLTSQHVCGHVTRATWLLRVPWAWPWAVDSFRHWNFSICSKNIGDMTILVEGYKHKNCENWVSL